MKRLARWVVAGAFLISASILAACGGGGGTPKITISSGGIMAIDQGQTLTFTATITNTNNGDTVAWTITSGPGTLAGATSTSAMYTAPASVNASTSVTITVTVSSSKGTVATQTITFMITPPPSLGPGGNLAAGTEGTAYSQSPTVTGGAGTLTWAVQANPNPLPAGLSINSSTGAITGTPTGPAGSSTFTVQLTDSGNPKITISAQFTILINNYQVPTLAPVSGALPAGIEGTTYANQTFTVSGGHAPFTFSIMNGSLPAGLTESSSNNMLVVSGKPAGPPCNPCTFSVKVVDSSNPAQTVTNNYSVVISLPPPPSITTASLPVGVEGAAYSQTLAATAGLAPYSFTVTTGTLPAGLSLNGSTGLISGTPT
ncbi:MAG: putative Ig domain-containing protein, partial [Candidatus Acidiferrales bacterium]